MRVAVTADLHWGISASGDAATRELARQVADLAPDLFVIAGDVGEGEEFARCLSLFASLECARALVPGNHDLWTRDPAESSWERYRERLPRLSADHGFHYLDHTPYLAPDEALAVAGSINWYDYSFADPELLHEVPEAPAMYRAKVFPQAVHNDGRFVRLGMTDEAFTGEVVDAFRGQMAALPASVERVLVVQHHPPVRLLFYPTALTTVDQRFWLAFTGNRRMQDAVLSDERITAVLCGHTHAFCEGEAAGKRCLNIGSDYQQKRLLLLDTQTGEETWRQFGEG